MDQLGANKIVDRDRGSPMSPISPGRLVIALLAALLAFPTRAAGSDKRVLDEIFGKWFLSQGGLGSSGLIRTYEIWETAEFLGPDQNHRSYDVHLARTDDGRYRFEISLPSKVGAGDIVQAYDGRYAWQAQPQWGLGLAPNPASDPWIFQNDLLLARRAFRARIDYRALAPAVVNGNACIVAGVKDATNIEGKCFFDRSTHRLLRLERPVGVGSPILFSVEFDDYRSLAGYEIPFVVRAVLGKSVTVYHRSKIVINPPIDEARFVLSTAQLQDALEANAILKRHDSMVAGTDVESLVHSRVTRLTIDISSSGLKFSETISQKAPNLILVEIAMPGMGQELRGFDGTTGWVESELQGYRPLKPPELFQLMNESRLHLETRLGESFPFRRRMGERVIDDRPTVALALATYQGPAGTYYFDKENGRLLRIGSPVVGDRANSTESTFDFSDFKVVDGVEIPFVFVQTNALTKVVSTVQSVVNNPTLSDDIFRPRSTD
jgi:hypothetical protein